MPFASIVLAHKNPDQVTRLVERLSPNPVFLHVDSKVDGPTWNRFRSLADHPTVTLLPRRRTGWGSWGLAQVALDGLRGAVASPGWSHVQLLSGQDYPLAPAPKLDAFFGDHLSSSFVASWSLPSPLWGRHGGLDRTRDLNRQVLGRRLRIRWNRRLPAGLSVRGGSMYWQLTALAASAVLEGVDRNPEWLRFLRGCWIPDELTIPSLVSSCVPADSVFNENLTFIRWSEVGGAHPDVLDIGSYPALRSASEGPSDQGGAARTKLFARKFDAQIDDQILDVIDRELLFGRR